MRTLDEILTGKPLIAILRGVPADEAVRIATEVWDSGIGVVEVPIQTPEAVAALQAVAAVAAERGELVGAGTVISAGLALTAAGAGASFTVAPGFDPDVLDASHAAGLPHLPGVGTATEVHRALAAGVTWLKVFPAGALGASWITAMRGPFPQARYVATGGVDAGNAAGFLRAGATALGVGGSITKPGGVGAMAAAIRDAS